MRNGGPRLVWERFERYGDIYYAPFLGRDVYVLRHPEHIKEVLISQAASFGKPTSGLTASQLNKLLGNGLLNVNGDEWRRRRRLLQPAFRSERLRAYADTVVRHADEQVGRWRVGERIDLSAEMMHLTLRIVCKTLFDHEVSSETDRVARAVASFRDAFGGVDAFVPDWVPLPRKRRVLEARAEVDRIVYDLIDERSARGSGGEDLLSALIEAGQSEGEQALTRKELRDELLTLFIAGHETTSHALSWTFHLLMTHADEEARVCEEVQGFETSPGWDELDALPRTRQALEESMRLFPPAYAIARSATREVQLGGYAIPAGADVVMWIRHVHRDPRWHERPLRFDPDRFAPEARRDMPTCAYLPFGAGQRTCIGKQFAMMEAQLILARVLRQWRFRPDPDHRVVPDHAVTMAPRGGLPVFLDRR